MVHCDKFHGVLLDYDRAVIRFSIVKVIDESDRGLHVLRIYAIRVTEETERSDFEIFWFSSAMKMHSPTRERSGENLPEPPEIDIPIAGTLGKRFFRCA